MDISEIMNTRDQLHNKENELEAIVKSLPELLLILDKD
jgi:hypothetical protein